MLLLLPIAALIFVSAITPGPNNVIVLQRAMARGARGAVSAIVAIVVGGVLMFALAQFGLAALLDEVPALQDVLLLSGVAYLAWLGLQMMRAREDDAPPRAVAGNAAMLVAFQFTNPKAWTLVVTTVAAYEAHATHTWSGALTLPLLFAAIATASLLAWALFGQFAQRHLRSPVARRRFDRGMGAVLVAASIAMLIEL
jgi:threonine/homoserine/homoserine lactone efflux protein